jgi:Xaa-Pro aminopeptidase
MHMLDPMELEKIDPAVIDQMTRTAREKTWRAVEHIKSLIVPGMTEQEAIKEANSYLAGQGVRKFWHRTHIRFGESTVLSFEDSYRDRVILKDHDIFYIDIGPVWDGVEGDCGDTFVVGDKPEHLKIKQDVRTLFERVKVLWRQERTSGAGLYDFARNEVEKMGYLLHPSYVKGHRLSEFSHFKYTKAGVADLDFPPAPERWILEFQICDKSMGFGAFYEDLLD